jgi:hypothetical protein
MLKVINSSLQYFHDDSRSPQSRGIPSLLILAISASGVRSQGHGIMSPLPHKASFPRELLLSQNEIDRSVESVSAAGKRIPRQKQGCIHNIGVCSILSSDPGYSTPFCPLV